MKDKVKKIDFFKSFISQHVQKNIDFEKHKGVTFEDFFYRILVFKKNIYIYLLDL